VSWGGQLTQPPESEVESASHALTSNEIDRILGFESTTPIDWAVIENGRGILSVSNSQSQGFRALAVAARGYVRFQSAALSSLGARLGSVIHVDVWVPPEVNSIDPYWHGAVQLNFSIPSLAVYNDYLGQAELTPLPVGQWSTLTFTPTAQQLGKLSGSYGDLRIILAINSAATDATPHLNFRVDNLRVSDKTQALVSVVDKDGHAISGATVVAYNASSATSNTAISDSAGLARVWVPVGHYRFAVTEEGATYFSAVGNHCHVPGLCVAATIVVKCHGVVCTAKDSCHGAGTCDPTNGQCSNPPLAAGTVCRAAVDACDVAEVCTGADAPCPADALAPATTVCRLAVGLCDMPESCNGTSAACPMDGFLQASLLCRPAVDVCDVPEICNGTSAVCPTDGFVSATSTCRPAVGPCDKTENCPGTGPACPNDAKAADGTACDDSNACTAQDACLNGACSGTPIPMPPTVRTNFTLHASWTSATGTSVDDERNFDVPAQIVLPEVIPVISGLAGNGTAFLSFRSATTCGDVICTYRGGSSAAAAVTFLDKFLGRMYSLQSCSDGTTAGSALAVTSTKLHVVSGDTGVGRSEVMMIVQFPITGQSIPVPDAGIPDPVVEPVPPPQTDHQDPGIPIEAPDLSGLQPSPMINGEYTPQAIDTQE
jgi:hypothetical protein